MSVIGEPNSTMPGASHVYKSRIERGHPTPAGEVSNFWVEDYDALMKFISVGIRKNKLKLLIRSNQIAYGFTYLLHKENIESASKFVFISFSYGYFSIIDLQETVSKAFYCRNIHNIGTVYL